LFLLLKRLSLLLAMGGLAIAGQVGNGHKTFPEGIPVGVVAGANGDYPGLVLIDFQPEGRAVDLGVAAWAQDYGVLHDIRPAFPQGLNVVGMDEFGGLSVNPIGESTGA
jgi:hypothetical protein